MYIATNSAEGLKSTVTCCRAKKGTNAGLCRNVLATHTHTHTIVIQIERDGQNNRQSAALKREEGAARLNLKFYCCPSLFHPWTHTDGQSLMANTYVRKVHLPSNRAIVVVIFLVLFV